MQRKLIPLVLGSLLVTGMSAVSAAETETSNEAVTIVYTNDVHSYIANLKDKTADDQPQEDALRFSKVSQLVNDMRAEGKNVLLVDAGDEVQGSSYGAIDEGESIINIMNAAGYQLATLGNHEFDYGPNTLFQRADQADYPYITCNFHTIEEGADGDPFEAVKVFEFGDTSVAFVGITTPETITSSTPVYFQDADGNYIYTIDGTANPQDLFDSVQAAIDSVRDDADYVIALAHTGIDRSNVEKGTSSYDIIANTTGLDAYIDGHSHTTMEGELVADKDGKDVLYTQTGCYLNAIGILEIAEDGSLQTKLINEYDGEDEAVAEVEDALIQKVEDELGQQIATLDTELYICNPDNSNQRLVRSREMNSGDLVADSVYWYFNIEKGMDCDMALINGGGVRSTTPAGDITINSAKNVLPFGNMICLIDVTGQQILDALEMGVDVVDQWDTEWNSPAENGGFIHPAGFRYTVDCTIPSSITLDENGMFASVDGDYRVTEVEIYNKETGNYEPIELDRHYRLAGINYLLRQSGNGLSMFSNCDMIVDYVGQDFEILADYYRSFTADGDYPRVNSANSPLAAYDGYLLDYENPYGSGRITLLGLDEETVEAEATEAAE